MYLLKNKYRRYSVIIILALSVLFVLSGCSQTTWRQTGGPEGGTIYSLAIDPSNTRIIYAGTNGGGVFKTKNGSRSWTAMNNGLPHTIVYSLAIDPSNSRIVYAGFKASGVYKTTDGGLSWTAMNNGLTNTDVRSLAIDPSNSQIVYTGTSEGLFKTTNGGSSWTEINFGFAWSVYVNSLVIDPSNSQIIYVGTFYSGVIKTTDGGASWAEMNNGLPWLVRVYSLARDPSNSRIMYAGTDFGGYKTTDGGASWTQMNIGLMDWDAYVLSLAINPSNNQIVYAGVRGGLLKTTDGGVSWTKMNTDLTGASFRSVAIDPSNSQVVYAGTEKGEGGTIINTGVYKTTDGGVSWTSMTTGLTNTHALSLAIDPTNSQVVYAGTSGGIIYDGPFNQEKIDGGVYKTTNGGRSWTAMSSGLTSGDVRSFAIDSSNSQIVYAGTDDGLFKTTDGGTSWTPVNNGIPSAIGVSSLSIDPKNSQIVYAGTKYYGAYKTTDGGASWSPVNNGLSYTGYSCEYYYPKPYNCRWITIYYILNFLSIDPSNSQVVYAGTNDGLFKTTDGGSSWTRIYYIGGASTVTSLTISPSNSRIIYAAVKLDYAGIEGGVCIYKTTDGGASWTKMNNSLMGADARYLAVDPMNSETVYLGTSGGIICDGVIYNKEVSGGVFKTTDGGASWTEMNDGLLNTNVFSLVLAATNREIIMYAGTDGNGVFKMRTPLLQKSVQLDMEQNYTGQPSGMALFNED